MGVVYIPVPKRVVEEARRRGVDVHEVLLSSLAKVLGLDPVELARARLAIAEKMLTEAKEYVARGDAVQASEKLYKAVEECIKALAEKLRVPQLKEVERRGRWDTWVLGKASREVAERLSEDRVRLAWKDAYDIHVWGFHEAKYGVEDVNAAIPLAEWLLNYTKKVIEESNYRPPHP